MAGNFRRLIMKKRKNSPLPIHPSVVQSNSMAILANWRNPPMLYHIWISKSQGIISSTSYSKQAEVKSSEWKYMGYTTDTVYPKKMNTGRILYLDKKLSTSRKTVSQSVSNR
jgi:hypothetical protein